MTLKNSHPPPPPPGSLPSHWADEGCAHLPPHLREDDRGEHPQEGQPEAHAGQSGHRGGQLHHCLLQGANHHGGTFQPISDFYLFFTFQPKSLEDISDF